jgi:hypothetical protein
MYIKVRKAMFPIRGLGIIDMRSNKLLGIKKLKEDAFETKVIGLQDE